MCIFAFSAELAVVQARQNELLALVQLYEALGGGGSSKACSISLLKHSRE
jgi:outer membrane protein TolC